MKHRKTMLFAVGKQGGVKILKAVSDAHVDVFAVGKDAGDELIVFFPQVNVICGAFLSVILFLRTHSIDQIMQTFRQP